MKQTKQLKQHGMTCLHHHSTCTRMPCGTKWTQSGQIRLNTDELILYSEHEDEDEQRKKMLKISWTNHHLRTYQMLHQKMHIEDIRGTLDQLWKTRHGRYWECHLSHEERKNFQPRQNFSQDNQGRYGDIPRDTSWSDWEIWVQEEIPTQ